MEIIIATVYMKSGNSFVYASEEIEVEKEGEKILRMSGKSLSEEHIKKVKPKLKSIFGDSKIYFYFLFVDVTNIEAILIEKIKILLL